MGIHKLTGSIQNYAWGSLSMLGQFQHRPTPTAAPEAELWFGDHPLAPSVVEIDGQKRRFDTFLKEHALEELGANVVHSFGRLPFLLKVLAVEQPLSIQVHPSAAQAKEGFERERALGIAVDDKRANYRDDWPKPELLCPLTPFDALCGFKPIEEVVALLQALGGECFGNSAKALANEPNADGLRQLTTGWLNATGTERTRLLASGLEACSKSLSHRNGVADSARFALELAERYPGDMGAFVALLLKRWLLQPGEGLFVPAGVMHAYLKGFAVEVMASSDNVLRGGLTPKHVDVLELLNLVNFSAVPLSLTTLEKRGPLETVYTSESRQFCFSTLEVSAHRTYCARSRIGPEMALCLDGAIELVGAGEQRLRLSKGECGWISAKEDVYCITGTGRVA